IRPQPMVAAEARSLTPKAKLSASTRLTWTDSLAGRSESPSRLCVRFSKQRRNSGKASHLSLATADGDAHISLCLSPLRLTSWISSLGDCSREYAFSD